MNAKKTLAVLSLAGALCAPAVAAAQSQAQATPGAPPVMAAVSEEFPLKLGGYFWTDTGYMTRDNTQTGTFDQDVNYMQGRLGLVAAFERSMGGLDATAFVELLGLVNEYSGSRYEAHVLDAYLKVGQKRWAVQIGRFLNSEVYYRGQGIELYTAEEAGAKNGPALYHLNFIRGHQDQPGQAALHLQPLDNVKIEISGVYGQESNQNWRGVRPMVDVGYAGFRLFAGYEYLKLKPNTDEFKQESTVKGWAARLQYAWGPLTAGVSYSQGDTEFLGNDGVLDPVSSVDKSSLGGFVDVDFWKNSVGLGYHLTTEENSKGLPDTNKHHQAFVSYLYRLPVDGLSVKAVLGFARAQLEDRTASGEWENDLTSFRVRVAYDFR